MEMAVCGFGSHDFLGVHPGITPLQMCGLAQVIQSPTSSVKVKIVASMHWLLRYIK